MFNLFKSSKTVIEQIHKEFNNAGDRLLKEAKEIIAGITIENEAKATRLNNLGFSSSKEVAKAETARKEKREKEEFAKAMEYFIIKYPKYKFITHDVAIKICEKYNLFIGHVRQYKGFVPEKNLKEIEEFFAQKNELSYGYFDNSWSTEKEVDKSDFDRQEDRIIMSSSIANQNPSSLLYQYNPRSYDSNRRSIRERKRDMKIAAPIKDMGTEGYKTKGRILEREVPDPVVLVPITKNNLQFYCIVTAWGDEASDENVINEINN